MGFQHLVFGSFQTVVGKGSCYSSLTGPPETGGGCWNLYQVRPRATPHQQWPGTMGYFLGNWLHLKPFFSKPSAPPTASFPLPPLHSWTCCRLVPTPGCSTEKTLSDSLQAKPSDLFLLSLPIWTPCSIWCWRPFPPSYHFLFPSGLCCFSLLHLPSRHHLFICLLRWSSTWTLVFLNFSLTFLSLHSSSPPTLSTDLPAPGFQFWLLQRSSQSASPAPSPRQR